jgi:hypothetical protein
MGKRRERPTGLTEQVDPPGLDAAAVELDGAGSERLSGSCTDGGQVVPSGGVDDDPATGRPLPRLCASAPKAVQPNSPELALAGNFTGIMPMRVAKDGEVRRSRDLGVTSDSGSRRSRFCRRVARRCTGNDEQ